MVRYEPCVIQESFQSTLPLPHCFDGHQIQGLKPGNVNSVQIVYILDQVRALEKEMIENINNQGLQIIPQIIVVGSHCYTYVSQSIYGLGLCIHITLKRS